jgi:hypothetical protein
LTSLAVPVPDEEGLPFGKIAFFFKNLVEKSIKFFRLDLVRSSRIGLGCQNSLILRFNVYQYFRFVVSFKR